jgi:prolyl oligopeptidase
MEVLMRSFDDSRRRLLALFGALQAGWWSGLPATSAAAASARVSGPPAARVEPVSETLWGETIVDRYRWMESPKDAEWEPFMRGQAAHARRVLDGLAGRAALHKRVAGLSAGLPIARAPLAAGNRLFYEMRPQGANQFKLYMREGESGVERLLIDPSGHRQGDAHVSLDWWLPSPDGRYVVHGLSPAGSENSILHVLEVDSGQLLPERIDRTQYASPSWLPDSSGFFFNRLAEGRKLGSVDYYLDSVTWLHRLRTDPKDDVRALARGQYPEIPVERSNFPFVGADPSSEHVLAIVYGGVRRENPVYVARRADLLAGRPRWLEVGGLDDEIVGTAVRGDELYLLTTRDAPNGKVLRTSMATPDLARAATVVPEGKTVLEGVSAARDGIYLRDMEGGYSSLRRLGNDGQVASLTLPFDGSVEVVNTDTRADGAWLDGTGWLLPFSVFRHDPANGQTRQVALAPRTDLDLSGYEAVRGFATARDGTRVPLSIVARKGLKRDGRNPTLVQAYGAYQVVSGPYFSARTLAFLEQGGVFATAHVRGGGEYGKRWWRAGQKLSKPNTWRDLIDCCEELVRQRWTRPSKLAIQGGSAGGITVGRALTERPDLFAAVISNVGVSNALRAEFSQNGPPNIDEFGTVTERAGFLGLKQMDALHAVRDDRRYPAVMLSTGMTDPRVEPWHAAKMAARLQAVPRRVNPVLLRIDFDAGHGLGSTRAQVDAERADEFAFVLWRCGHPKFQPV